MDTKSKDTKKYPLIVKALCLVLSALCFLGTGVCAVYGVLAAKFLPLSGDITPVSFYESDLFRDMISEDLTYLSEVLYEPQRQAMLKTYRAKRDAAIDEEVRRYLTKKASIIRAEIYFVATHYDEIEEGDYYYNAYMRDFSMTTAANVSTTEVPTVPHSEAAEDASTTEPTTVPPETTTAANEADLSALPKLKVDERAPYNVRYCQSLCNTVTGLDWLAYETLVRDTAFREQEYSPSYGDLGHYNTYTYTYSEAQIRTQFEQEYDALLHDREETDVRYAQAHLDAMHNLKYLVIAEDGTVSTNMAQNQKNSKNILSHNRYILCKDGGVTVHIQDSVSTPTIESIVHDQIEPTGGTLYVYFEEPFVPGDRYAAAKELFDKLFLDISPKTALITGIVCAVGAVFFFVTLLCLCGHKSGVEGITLAFIDRVPTDVHLLVSGTLIGFSSVTAVVCVYDIPEYIWTAGFDSWQNKLLRVIAATVLLLLAYLFAIEWLTSTVRIKKAGQSYFRRFVLWKVVRAAWRGVRFCTGKLAALIHFLLDKPKKLRYLPFILFAAMIVFSIPAALLAAASGDLTPLALFVPFLTVLLLLGAVWFLRMLDQIAEAAEARTDLPQSVTCKMPRALRNLAENLSVTNRELDKAVADAVRNERTKAELITNVSHDLKTPLTSVITYVDLLKKCDITDEKARGYLDVLDEKSAKLKRLVEDLIEASKVNTGNVTLHCVPLNLAELAMQAVTETAADFEEQSLELKFTPPEHAPIVFADGAKTYRILDNLLSNARKYSAPGSRVYAKAAEDETCGIFEIKNISREPLDIDPQELMERFVRGDRSRTQDGNGLGLSIAQQLCLLQGGRLEIGIDGDLFKATVYLPKQKTVEGSIPQT